MVWYGVVRRGSFFYYRTRVAILFVVLYGMCMATIYIRRQLF